MTRPLFRDGSLAHDLKVIYADLTVDQPQAAGPDVDSALMFWPREVIWPPQVFDAAKDARLLLNREMIDVVQRNLNANFSLLRKVAGARSFGEVIELQASHLSNQVTALIGQSNELATLLAKTAMEFMRGAYLDGVICTSFAYGHRRIEDDEAASHTFCGESEESLELSQEAAADTADSPASR